MLNLPELAENVIKGYRLNREEALALLATPDEDLLLLLHSAYRIRRHFRGDRMRIHVLQNAKSGLCPEDCSFCSQSSVAETPIERYRLQSKDEIVAGAVRAKEARAYKYCIVTSTKSPSGAELKTICDAVREIKQTVGIRVCASLGALNDNTAAMLKEAGVDKFNHNLETSERLFPSICTTHTFQDRVATVSTVQKAGMETCCGGIVGMTEADEDIVDLAMKLRELNVDSIPINFLDSRPGTALGGPPVGGRRALTPAKCLKALALFRFIHPDKDIRAAGGREVNLRSLQPLALYAANSIFTEGYLTTGGNEASADHRMIADLGFTIDEGE